MASTLRWPFDAREGGRKRGSLVDEEVRGGGDMKITVYRIPLVLVTSFNYLGRLLLSAEDDWPEVFHELQRARQKWSRLYRVLSR